MNLGVGDLGWGSTALAFAFTQHGEGQSAGASLPEYMLKFSHVMNYFAHS